MKVYKIRRIEGFRGFGAFRPVKTGRSWYSGSIVCRPSCACMWCTFEAFS